MMGPRIPRLRPMRPTYYPTPYDRKQAVKRAIWTAAWVVTFAGLGVLLAWRM